MLPQTEARASPPLWDCGPDGAGDSLLSAWHTWWFSRPPWLWPQPSGLLGKMKNLGKASRAAGCPQQSNQGRHGTNGPAQAITVRPGKIRSASSPFPGQSRTPQSQSAARQSRPGPSGAWPPFEASSWWSKSNSYPLCLLKGRQGGTETCGSLDTLQWRGWGQAGGCCPPTLAPVALLPGCPCCSDGTHQGQVSPLSAVSE